MAGGKHAGVRELVSLDFLKINTRIFVQDFNIEIFFLKKSLCLQIEQNPNYIISGFFRQFIYSFSQQKIPNMGTDKRIKQPLSGKTVLSINKAFSETVITIFIKTLV